VDQRTEVLWKTGAAKTGPRVEKLGTDTGIRSDALPHVLDVDAEFFRQIGELVHERDAHREHAVRGVLGELGRANVHDDQPVPVAIERGIQLPHRLARFLVVGADDDPVGLHEVRHREPFLQEFGIRCRADMERNLPLIELLLDRLLDEVVGADRNGRLHDHE
jgi:hypothetical protein